MKVSQAFLGALLTLAAIQSGVLHFTILKGGVDIGSRPAFLEPEAAAGSRASRSKVNICPSALELFDNASDVEKAVEDNIQFHQRGGNLKSIEGYLNSHMQSTLDRLGISFTPNGANASVGDAIGYLSDYYKKNAVERGGYGQPLPGALRSSHHNKMIRKTLFERRWINVIEADTASRFGAGIGPVGPDCPNRVTFSNGTWEEKFLCGAADSRKRGQQGRREGGNCSIFAIGSNGQWGFEGEVLEKLPGCVTHTFDCTLKGGMRLSRPSYVRFYPYCIGPNGAKPPYLPYERLWRATNARAPPRLLKMDIEGFEYDVLQSILSSDPSAWPEQIIVEVHWATRMVGVPWMPRTRTAAEISLFFGLLFHRGGYVALHTSASPGCPVCLEVLLVRAVC